MNTERDSGLPTDTTQGAEALGLQKQTDCDVEQRRRRNVEDEERGPLDQTGVRQHKDQAVDAPESGKRGEDNLVQLPVGAEFSLDHEPSPHEREELVRFAADVEAEIRRQDERTGYLPARRNDRKSHAQQAGDRRDQDAGQ